MELALRATDVEGIVLKNGHKHIVCVGIYVGLVNKKTWMESLSLKFSSFTNAE